MIEFMERMGINPDNFEWQELSLCGSLGAADPELAEVWHSKAERDERVKAIAKEICDVCPIKKICLEEGVRNKEYGIWGGHTLQAGKVVD